MLSPLSPLLSFLCALRRPPLFLAATLIFAQAEPAFARESDSKRLKSEPTVPAEQSPAHLFDLWPELLTEISHRLPHQDHLAFRKAHPTLNRQLKRFTHLKRETLLVAKFDDHRQLEVVVALGRFQFTEVDLSEVPLDQVPQFLSHPELRKNVRSLHLSQDQYNDEEIGKAFIQNGWSSQLKGLTIKLRGVRFNGGISQFNLRHLTQIAVQVDYSIHNIHFERFYLDELRAWSSKLPERYPRLSELSVSATYGGTSDRAVVALAQGISQFRTLRSLTWSGPAHRDLELPLGAVLLNSAQVLQAVSLELYLGTGFGPEGEERIRVAKERLLPSLGQCQGLKRLKLRGLGGWSEEEVELLTQLGGLEVLSLSGYDEGFGGATGRAFALLLDWIRGLKDLKSLELRSFDLTDRFLEVDRPSRAVQLGAALSSAHRLESLELRYNQLGTQGLFEVLKGLSDQSRLVTLRVENNGITNHYGPKGGIPQLDQGDQHKFRFLKNLDLSENLIFSAPYSLQVLAKVLIWSQVTPSILSWFSEARLEDLSLTTPNEDFDEYASTWNSSRSRMASYTLGPLDLSGLRSFTVNAGWLGAFIAPSGALSFPLLEKLKIVGPFDTQLKRDSLAAAIHVLPLLEELSLKTALDPATLADLTPKNLKKLTATIYGPNRVGEAKRQLKRKGVLFLDLSARRKY